MSSIEYEILLVAGNVDPDKTQQARLSDLLAGDFNQDRLIRLAQKEGLSGLLFKSFKKAGILGFFGHRQLQQLQSFYYRTVQHNLQIIHDLKQILHHSHDEGIRVVLLQGAALLVKVYRDIGLRPLTDIDLWILPDQRAAFEALMARLNYEPDPVYPNTFANGSTIVDINSHILWADRIKSRQRLLAKNQQSIYDSIDIINFENIPAGCLREIDLVLYLSLHTLKHSASRLIWLVDIKELITAWQSADWEKLLDRADELGQVNIVYYMLYLIDSLFHLKLPADIEDMAADRSLTWLERVVLEKRLEERPLPDWAPLLLFAMGKDLKTRACFFFETLFPRPSVLKQVFSDRPDLGTCQLYMRRALQLFRMVKSSKSI